MTENESGPAALLERLERGELLISDGATGTFLQQHGLEPGGCPEEFNASRPEVVREMARQYFEAGADMSLTNSFGGSIFMQKKYRYGERVVEFNRPSRRTRPQPSPAGPLCRRLRRPYRRVPGTARASVRERDV